MSSLIPSGGASGTGSVTLLAPNTNSNQTQTLPDATGTVMVSGNMPAFKAYSTGSQSVSNQTYTKIQVNTRVFDTNNYFNVINYRFTPLIGGYYQVNAQVAFDGALTGTVQAAIYKNGNAESFGNSAYNQTQIGGVSNISDVIFLKGSTDYIELYGWQGSGGALTTQASSGYARNFLSATLVRAA